MSQWVIIIVFMSIGQCLDAGELCKRQSLANIIFCGEYEECLDMKKEYEDNDNVESIVISRMSG